MKNNFPQNLKKYRTQRGMTQEELSRMIHIDRTTLTKYERGNAQPSIEVIYELVEILGISFNDLFM